MSESLSDLGKAPAPPPEGWGKTVYINFHGGIGTQSCNNLMTLASQAVDTEGADTVYVLFSSGGGSVDAGVTTYNFLKSLPVRLVMHNIGSVDSIATVIFLAGAVRYAAPNANFLFHGATMTFSGAMSKGKLDELSGSLGANLDRMAEAVCAETRLSEPQVRAFFQTGQTLGATEAASVGIIGQIRSPVIPRGAKVLTVNTKG